MKNTLSRIELLIIGLFFVLFFVWAASKCNSKKSELAAEDAATESVDGNPSVPASLKDSLKTDTLRPAPMKALPQNPNGVASSNEGPATPGQPTAAPPNPNAQYTRLWVVIDGLKLRKEPDLKGEAIGSIPLFEEVYFLNERTEFRTEVNLGTEMANEPWLKVRTKKGREGWVYGAGVDILKEKRKGVLETPKKKK